MQQAKLVPGRSDGDVPKAAHRLQRCVRQLVVNIAMGCMCLLPVSLLLPAASRLWCSGMKGQTVGPGRSGAASLAWRPWLRDWPRYAKPTTQRHGQGGSGYNPEADWLCCPIPWNGKPPA